VACLNRGSVVKQGGKQLRRELINRQPGNSDTCLASGTAQFSLANSSAMYSSRALAKFTHLPVHF
jgi:hypothetical protein